MKTFKQLDCIIQIGLISGFLLLPLLNMIVEVISDPFETLLPAYFSVGGWQIISVITHIKAPREYKIKLRKIYLKMLLYTGIVGLVACATLFGIMPFFLALLFWSPILAGIYLVTCIRETRTLNKVPDQLLAE